MAFAQVNTNGKLNYTIMNKPQFSHLTQVSSHLFFYSFFSKVLQISPHH